MRLPIEKVMSDQDLLRFVTRLNIPNFCGVFMRDELKHPIRDRECGILNLNTHEQKGSHWVCWMKCGQERYYFDSYGESPPLELIKYLKTSREIKQDIACIRRSAVTVQKDGSSECGALCLYVLKKLSQGVSFPVILDALVKRYESSRPSSQLVIKT